MSRQAITPQNAGRFTVYFAGSMGKVKIGCSIKPEERILRVGEWIPFPITMLATMKGTYVLESVLHRMFADEWTHGEWFHGSPRLLEFIDRVARGLPVEIVDCRLPEAENRRRKAIADKKRLARKRHLLPSNLLAELCLVPKGGAIPDALLAMAWSIINGPKPNRTRAA